MNTITLGIILIALALINVVNEAKEIVGGNRGPLKEAVPSIVVPFSLFIIAIAAGAYLIYISK